MKVLRKLAFSLLMLAVAATPGQSSQLQAKDSGRTNRTESSSTRQKVIAYEVYDWGAQPSTPPFNPDLKRGYVSTHGDIQFNHRPGFKPVAVYSNGWIHFDNKTWWSPTGDWEMRGTFVNKQGKKGKVVFYFESECRFTGEFSYQGSDNTKYPWYGMCKSGKPRPKGGWGCRAVTPSCRAETAGLLVEEWCVKHHKNSGCFIRTRGSV